MPTTLLQGNDQMAVRVVYVQLCNLLYFLVENSYLCNKLGNVIFFRITPCTEKMDFLRIAHMIFSTGVWKIHKIWIFLIFINSF
jgi:hypothetical protein